MPNILTRDDFRKGVFARDKNLCVICKSEAQDAHHIIERRLFNNGGYFINNGASLCGACHILAEQTILSCKEIRKAAGINKRVLPEHLYEDYEYTKWGDILNENNTRYPGELFWDESVQKILAPVLHLYLNRFKYPRTYHIPHSPGATNDDKKLTDYSIFEKKEIVISVKMDGENTSGYSDGYIHARSLDGRNHESRNWLKNFLPAKLYDLPEGWRICGENLYAKHSIHYTNLKSYFYLFSIWNNRNECLSWGETETWANLLEIDNVPILYKGLFNLEKVIEIIKNLDTNNNEGFVIRLADKFPYSKFKESVAKYVRENHIQSSEHWIKKKIVPNKIKL